VYVAAVLRGVAAAGATLAVLTGAASAAPERDALVRPGIGIGPIEIGMTQAQVQRMLGAPTLTNRRYPLGFGRSYVEHDWDYARWTVGYEGRPGQLRVVRVATNTRTQRTPQRIGVGSRPRDVIRAYRNARCVERNRTDGIARVGRFLTVRAPSGRLTSFLVGTPWYGQDRTHRVLEVMVSTTARIRGERDFPCPAGWQQE
jgi:hypothetical protein